MHRAYTVHVWGNWQCLFKCGITETNLQILNLDVVGHYMAKDKYLLSSPFTILSMSTTLTFGISSFQNLLSFSFSHFLNRLICFPHHEFIKFLIKIYLTQYQIVLMVGLDLRIFSFIFENFLERRPDKNFDRVFCVEENCPFRSLERKP